MLGVTGSYEPIERLKERHGKGVTEAKAVETPSKRTKKTDKAKLVRQVIFEIIGKHRKYCLTLMSPPSYCSNGNKLLYNFRTQT